MTLSKAKREALRMLFGGRCAYCGCDLSGKWHADHVQPVNRELKFSRNKSGRTVMVATGKFYSPENDCHGNLFPACGPCNIDKGSNELEVWRSYLNERMTEGLRRNSSTFRHAERFGRVSIVPGPLVFWFEKYDPDAALVAAREGQK